MRLINYLYGVILTAQPFICLAQKAQQSVHIDQAVHVLYHSKELRNGQQITIKSLIPPTVTKFFFDDNKLVFLPDSELYISYWYKKKKYSVKWDYGNYLNATSKVFNNGELYSRMITIDTSTKATPLTYNCFDNLADQHKLLNTLSGIKKAFDSRRCLKFYLSEVYWINGPDTLEYNDERFALKKIQFIGKDTVDFIPLGNRFIIDPKRLPESNYKVNYVYDDRLDSINIIFIYTQRESSVFKKRGLSSSEALDCMMQNYAGTLMLEWYDKKSVEKLRDLVNTSILKVYDQEKEKN